MLKDDIIQLISISVLPFVTFPNTPRIYYLPSVQIFTLSKFAIYFRYAFVLKLDWCNYSEFAAAMLADNQINEIINSTFQTWLQIIMQSRNSILLRNPE